MAFLANQHEGINLLKGLYHDVSEWLKFGEAKNAALLAFNGVLIFGLLQLDTINKFKFLYGTVSTCVLILAINIVIILCSFLPARSQDNKTKNIAFSVEQALYKNYLFYGNLGQINDDQFTKVIKEKYGFNIDENNFTRDLSLQILSVSAIARRKNNFFTLCTYITIAVFLILIIKVLSYIF